MAQKTRSSNWVLKLSSRKNLFESILVLKFCSRYILLLGFFYFKLFICPSDIKGHYLTGALPRESPPSPSRLRYKSIVELTVPWGPHLHFTTFENSILVLKTDISRTACINPCLYIEKIKEKKIPLSLLQNLWGSLKSLKQQFM